MNRTKLAILFGGKSPEHEVSLRSAASVISALHHDRYDLRLIGITKEGIWKYGELEDPKNTTSDSLQTILNTGETVNIHMGAPVVFSLEGYDSLKFHLDAVFPVLHGSFGEDGTLQGLLAMLDIPCVGPDTLGSTVSMDKDVMKRMFVMADIPTARWHAYRIQEKSIISYSKLSEELGEILFVKPASMGSSVGVHKVTDEATLSKAVEDAFLYDNKIIIEEYIIGREIELSALGNEDELEHYRISLPGEIIPANDFYSYEAKYLDDKGAALEMPARVDETTVERLQTIALNAFRTLNCEGLSRVDVFLKESGEVYLNEINTLPGFTSISMYPKLWEISGLSYSDLLDELVRLAMERHKRNNRLRRSFLS